MADDREEVAVAARTIVEGVAEANAEALTAEAALEAAEARAEAAEEIAEQLADAALRDMLGRSIADLREEVEQWRAQTNQTLESQAAEIQNLRAEVASLTTALAEAKASPAPAVIPASSIPGELAEQTEAIAETVTGAVVEPEAASPAESVALIVPVAPARRGHWM